AFTYHIGAGSGNHWADGIYNSDWSGSNGSDSYRNGLAMGLKTVGGRLYDVGAGGFVQERDGKLGIWMDVFNRWFKDGVFVGGEYSHSYFKPLDGQQTNYRNRMSQQEIKIFDSMTENQRMNYLGNGNYAETLAGQLFEGTLHNGKGDAFRHALFSALNSRDLGLELTKKLSDAHELHPLETKLGRDMDLHNNMIGREIFSLLDSRGLGQGPHSTEGFGIFTMKALEQGFLKEIVGGNLVSTKK
ncbi:MAG: hypothetical protein OEW40_21725, partial [Cyclobacteriaceae bacterium]|nr:hypothetical protein [Cyclobacteriaceae bacterium]